ncbi:type II toxin-antitoxin system PemK/MazF family toxin [Paenibacillus chitinolyticus]|uniref:mRNA interferase n=2 Tax=Paenibacillus chitinolyticus TaxID=79263 RepID=A0A410X4W9_9BACL|nr:type II toxin-antitoxin system PemK/MazF family toxin [Paenibacillus chitinolyticus]MCY9595852.1 type II toxin-antitoxin system PemK/MazF family toxin [Paenibacillus chitinolyticus]QAV21661.1 type II toxin-antitoxin system PemK/MazF family toxin [Paenibacillus chitinolyticus]
MVNRGEVWMVKFDGIGSEQRGLRPALVISNNRGNKYGSTVIVCAITAQVHKAKLPTHVVLKASPNGTIKDSVVMLEQVRTVDKSRLLHKLARVGPITMGKVTEAHAVSCSGDI